MKITSTVYPKIGPGAIVVIRHGFDPTQPRDPKGSETGGQWADTGGSLPRNEGGGHLPSGSASGKTIRTVKGKKIVIEDAVNQSLMEAKDTPEAALQTKNAEKELRYYQKNEMQILENRNATFENPAKKISDEDVILDPDDIIMTARRLKFLDKFGSKIGQYMNPTQIFKTDWASAETVFQSMMDYLDRRSHALAVRWQKSRY